MSIVRAMNGSSFEYLPGEKKKWNNMNNDHKIDRNICLHNFLFTLFHCTLFMYHAVRTLMRLLQLCSDGTIVY